MQDRPTAAILRNCTDNFGDVSLATNQTVRFWCFSEFTDSGIFNGTFTTAVSRPIRSIAASAGLTDVCGLRALALHFKILH